MTWVLYKWEPWFLTALTFILWYTLTFPGGSVVREFACSAGDEGSIPGSGRSPGGGQSTHFNILVWRIPWSEEPGDLQSMGSQSIGHAWSDWAHTHTCTYVTVSESQHPHQHHGDRHWKQSSWILRRLSVTKVWHQGTQPRLFFSGYLCHYIDMQTFI